MADAPAPNNNNPQSAPGQPPTDLPPEEPKVHVSRFPAGWIFIILLIGTAVGVGFALYRSGGL